MQLFVFIGVLITVTFNHNTVAESFIVDPAQNGSSMYPEWAHHHWVWYDHGGQGQSDLIQLVQDYMKYNISVGAVDVDSTWETGYNTFEFDTSKYPNASAMVDTFHKMGVRVILWITSFVDTDSPNYQEGLDKGYYLKNLFGGAGKMKWWHGKGSLIDYTNPDAVDWWHSQMDKALDLNIDGWKCDGTDPYINELGFAQGHNGTVFWHEYSDQYYGDFFDYTREKLGDDRLIMSRPVDAFGPLFVRFSPHRVMISGWVGDEDDTFQGLEGTLKRYLQSAWRGYANFGSDIGGYRNPQKPRQYELFLRWAQLGAFSPLMENGGGGEHRPWMVNTTVSTFVTTVYRRFVDIHYSLIPYFLTIGNDALMNNHSVMHPLAPHEDFIDKVIDQFQPETYDYLLGDRYLVAPIVKPGSNNQTTTKVWTPPDSGSWTFFFDHTQTISGNKTSFTCPLGEFPVFMKNSSLFPLNLTRDDLFAGIRGGTDKDVLTVLVTPTESGRNDSFTVLSDKRGIAQGQALHLTMNVHNDRIDFSVSAHQTLKIRYVLISDRKPKSVQVHSADHDNMVEVDEVQKSCLDGRDPCWRIENLGTLQHLYMQPGNIKKGARISIFL